MKWIRIWTQETLQSTTFQELNDVETGIWFKLLIMAGANIRNAGIIEIRDGIPYPLGALTIYLNTTEEHLSQGIAKLIEVDKLEQLKDGRLRIKKFTNYQSRWYKKVSEIPSETLQQTASEKVKGNDREIRTDKIRTDKIYICVLNFWNRCSRWAKRRKLKGLIECRKTNRKMITAISQRLSEYDYKTARQAIYNYHKFLLLPREQKRWQGYRWNIFEFMVRGKDNIERFSDWDVIACNWLTVNESPVKEYMALDKAVDCAKREQTTHAWEVIIARLTAGDRLAFKKWVYDQDDAELRRLWIEST